MSSPRLPILVRLAILFIFTIIVVLLPKGWGQSNKSEQTAPPTLAKGPSVQEGLIAIAYENGTLTITARNAPLLDVLRTVCQQMGAEFEAPDGASERVVVEAGPGPARQVLTSLLAGSQFDYVIQASDHDSNLLALLVVSLKSLPSPEAEVSPSRPSSSGSHANPNPAGAAASKIDPATAKQESQQLRDFLAGTKKQIASLVIPDSEGQSSGTIDPPSEPGAFGMLNAALKVADSAGADVNPQALSGALSDTLPAQPHRRRH
jgi:hypothetical protein